MLFTWPEQQIVNGSVGLLVGNYTREEQIKETNNMLV